MQCLLQSGNQFIGSLGLHKAGHILHMDEGNAHLFLFQSVLYKLFCGVEGADVVRNGALNFLPGFFHRLEGGFTVAQILKGIED